MPVSRRRLVVTVFAILALFAGVVSLAVFQGLFEPRTLYPTEAEPLDVVAGDVDADGKIDLLVANREGRSFSLYRGRGNGSFRDAVSIPTTDGATSLALGDMNDDGRTDVVVSTCTSGCSSSSIRIFLGRRDGSFDRGPATDLQGVAYNVTLADLDGDRRLDIAASDYPNDRLIVLLTLWETDRFAVRQLPTGSKPIALEVADLNDDGMPDLISSDHGDASSTVYLAYAGGEFSEPITVPTGELPYTIALASVDGDRLPDLVVGHSTEEGRLSILQGRGDGTFTFLDELEVSPRVIFVETADFDRDGAADILVTGLGEAFASVYLNEGDGMFEREATIIPSEATIYSAAVADLDADGLPDLVTVDFEAALLAVALATPVDRR